MFTPWLLNSHGPQDGTNKWSSKNLTSTNATHKRTVHWFLIILSNHSTSAQKSLGGLVLIMINKHECIPTWLSIKILRTRIQQ
jgi:hypothetical protein